MVKRAPSSLIVTKAHYDHSPEYLGKLIRGALYGLKITNRQFQERYPIAFADDPSVTDKNVNSLISALQADIYNNEKIMSLYIFCKIVKVLGGTISEMSVTLTHTETKQTVTLSTDMTAQDLETLFNRTGEAGFITKEQYEASPPYLSKLIRGLLYGLNTTNKEFQALYRKRFAYDNDARKKNGTSRISAIKGAINDNKKGMSFYIFDTNVRILGYRITDMGFTLVDNVTLEVRKFWTHQTADEIDAAMAELTQVGITSL